MQFRNKMVSAILLLNNWYPFLFDLCKTLCYTLFFAGYLVFQHFIFLAAFLYWVDLMLEIDLLDD